MIVFIVRGSVSTEDLESLRDYLETNNDGIVVLVDNITNIQIGRKE